MAPVYCKRASLVSFLFAMRLFFTLVFLTLSPVAQAQLLQTEAAEFRHTPEVLSGLGWSVAMDGDWLAVGDYAGNIGVGGNGQGLVELYERTDQGWISRQTITSPEPGHGFQFGYDVDLRGDYLIIGEPHWGWSLTANSNAPFYKSGKAHLFKKQGSQWVFELTLRPTIPVPQTGDFNGIGFGLSVCLGDGKIAIGAPFRFFHPHPVHTNGMVYTYNQVGGTWVWDQALYPPTHLEFPYLYGFGQFGSALDFDGNRLAIGAPAGGGGNVTTWRRLQTGWQFEDLLDSPFPPNLGVSRRFGRSVSLSGNYLAAGMTSGWCSNPTCRSVVAIHEFSNASWSRIQVIDEINSEPGSHHAYFGHRVELSGDQLVVSANNFQTNGYGTGDVRLYDRQPGQDFQLVKRFGIDNLVPGYGNGQLGQAIAVDFQRGCIVAGNPSYHYPSNDTPEGWALGAAFLFDIELGQDLACTGTDNSSGRRSHLAVTGNLSIARDSLYLHASHLPPNQLALYVYAQPGPPFPIVQGGELCFSSPMARMIPAGVVGPLGERILHVDLSAPREALNLMPGTTWAFQAWHRDLVGGVSVTGTTNAVQVTLE